MNEVENGLRSEGGWNREKKNDARESRKEEDEMRNLGHAQCSHHPQTFLTRTCMFLLMAKIQPSLCDISLTKKRARPG